MNASTGAGSELEFLTVLHASGPTSCCIRLLV